LSGDGSWEVLRENVNIPDGGCLAGAALDGVERCAIRGAFAIGANMAETQAINVKQAEYFRVPHRGSVNPTPSGGGKVG
jgi:hypothetical protein